MANQKQEKNYLKKQLTLINMNSYIQNNVKENEWLEVIDLEK